MDPPGLVSEGEPGSCRRSIEIADRQLDGDARLDVEEDRRLGAESLAGAAHVEPDGRRALAGRAAVDEGEAVLDAQAAQVGRHRRAGEHLDMQETALVAFDLEGRNGTRRVLAVLAVFSHAPGALPGVNR